MADFEVTPELLKTIEILEGLEILLEQAPTPAISEILQEAWLQVTRTFPEDFQEATCDDAGAEGLRRYLRVKAAFSDPGTTTLSWEDLQDYYRHRLPIELDDTDEDK
ncbi:hypothetical protein [Alkalinema sp. FACHB-956]|uniref:hypothetical protein n=1 Tax=Alkalinema sp. FACHB-956 TaxID=2692768 RepID=UPI0016844B04|nr:hypothetical protein [Alkalinema sp. FACHB-956]MBD2326257.1 hypothetical protein [Alkalinema sp. FACHB-956]